ncbi:hypothetical protein RRG08_008717 [Elysia crispata]|uniref:Uncharacterized protein n=1 Tax=Elysia crispata TaxID=231223 RepID=A0AAE0XQ53_9GAST|nr:hypothetical protein RRG08_008717 [Elysia crispata]
MEKHKCTIISYFTASEEVSTSTGFNELRRAPYGLSVPFLWSLSPLGSTESGECGTRRHSINHQLQRWKSPGTERVKRAHSDITISMGIWEDAPKRLQSECPQGTYRSRSPATADPRRAGCGSLSFQRKPRPPQNIKKVIAD